jgi:hypothetical protein
MGIERAAFGVGSGEKGLTGVLDVHGTGETNGISGLESSYRLGVRFAGGHCLG